MAVGIIVLSFLFSYRDFWLLPIDVAFRGFILNLFFLSLIFGIHEYAHARVARRFGCRTRYATDWRLLFLAVILALFSGGMLILAAIGTIAIEKASKLRRGYSELSREEIGKISIAGPLTSFFLAILFAMLTIAFPPIYSLFWMSISLTTFSLVPLPQFDGGKIFGWSPIAWATLLCGSIMLWVLYQILWLFFILFPLLALILFLIFQRFLPRVEKL